MIKCVLLDTGVWIRGVGQRQDDDAEDCRQLLDRLATLSITMVVAAPSVAEAVRGPGGYPNGPPGLEVIAFGHAAAHACGSEFPEYFIEDTRAFTGLREHYVKYDAMIVACALAEPDIEAVVSLDMGVHALCDQAGASCYTPSDLLDRLPLKRRRSRPRSAD